MILNCDVAKLPIIYLGLPLHFKKVRKEVFQNLIDKIRSRRAAWKTIHAHPRGTSYSHTNCPQCNGHFPSYVAGSNTMGLQSNRQNSPCISLVRNGCCARGTLPS
jgi:hypothetical protein